MRLDINGIRVTFDEQVIAEVMRQRLLGAPSTALLPKIGESYQGGIYAGIARGSDGQPDYHLIAGPEHDGDITWNDAVKWAPGLKVSGYSDFDLPTRKEQALLFANVPELFKERVYWSKEPRASLSGCAWGQYFYDGYQSDWGKDDSLRALAVRRSVIH